MGFRYKELKERGESIELERRESFITEHSPNGYIKRRKTVLRERFRHSSAAKELTAHMKSKPPHTELKTTKKAQRKADESGRCISETFAYSPESGTLRGYCRDKSQFERAVNRTSVQLQRLTNEIDNEIAKLKCERNKLLLIRPHPHRLLRNTATQTHLQGDETKSTKSKKVNLTKFDADNIEFTIEKFSSQHKFTYSSPRHARDKQTSCRPHMRTIGLQKDISTQRGDSIFCDNLQNLNIKLHTVLPAKLSATNLAYFKTKAPINDVAPSNCYAFDYGGTGDGQSALKLYHLQNCCAAGGVKPNECNCRKICERYSNVGKYNGMVCNKNTYVEKGVMPCKEYKYCRDEYHYDYPRQNLPNGARYTPSLCVPYQSCQLCQPCPPCMPCPTYNESQAAKLPQVEAIYGRRMSDLNTDEFFHPTDTSPRKHSPTRHVSRRKRSNTRERLTLDVPKDGRTTVNIETHGRAHTKSRSKSENDDVTKNQDPKCFRGASPDDGAVARWQMRQQKLKSRKGETSAFCADLSDKRQHLKTREKLLEITFTKERRCKPSSGSADKCIPNNGGRKNVREYSQETKRSMKQMTITAYKPHKSNSSEDERDYRKKRESKQKQMAGDGKSGDDDDKTWDQQLKRGEVQPQEVDDWRDCIPTATELYDNCCVGDAWEMEEDNISTQSYMRYYRETCQVSPRRSYDIMPVQKDTVRDIPPTQSPRRGRRFSRSSNAQNSKCDKSADETGYAQEEKPRSARGYEHSGNKLISEGAFAQEEMTQSARGSGVGIKSGKKFGVANSSRKDKLKEESGSGKSGLANSPTVDLPAKSIKTENLLQPETVADGDQPGQEKKEGGKWTDIDNINQQPLLSPFPSLESPRIYMRPHNTCPDYKSACLPPPNTNCSRSASPHENCIDKDEDPYMRRTEQSYNPSPCTCISPKHNENNGIHYQKLSDRYTHSPVRQIAANPHVAVAFQPEAAGGIYIPSPQMPNKSSIHLRSIGTQYSATNIENHTNCCAPQYIPLPNNDTQITLEEQQEDRPAPCYPKLCDVPPLPNDAQLVSCNKTKNYNFACEELNAECVDEINLNDQLYQKLEITNSERNQVFQPQQQIRDYLPRLGGQNYMLPWSHEQKYVPGQPLNDNCHKTNDGMKQRPHYQGITERRTPNINATMPPHLEMPEEEDEEGDERYAEEIPQYKPQPREKFMEENSRKFERENSNRRHYSPASERAGFYDCRRELPKFTGCPCMLDTYLNMITLYYPNSRLEMPDDDRIRDAAVGNY